MEDKVKLTFEPLVTESFSSIIETEPSWGGATNEFQSERRLGLDHIYGRNR